MMDKGYLERLATGTKAYFDRITYKAHKRQQRIKARIENQSLVEGVQYRQSKTGILRPVKPKVKR